jgi:hypothetical protein
VLQGLQKTVDFDEPEDDEEMAAIEQELAEAAMHIDLAQEMREDALTEQTEADVVDGAELDGDLDEE